MISIDDHDIVEKNNDEQEEADPLEAEFREVAEQAESEIETALAKASEYLKKAVSLSEKYGVPFESRISFIRNTYTPQSFSDKFGDLDPELVSEVTDTWDEDSYEYGAGVIAPYVKL